MKLEPGHRHVLEASVWGIETGSSEIVLEVCDGKVTVNDQVCTLPDFFLVIIL